MSLKDWAVRGLLALLLVPAVAETASAQYVYQPSPSYYRNDTLQGSLLGGGVGALAGAAIGGKNQRGQGALIGGGVGLLAGALAGKAADNADERAAVAGSAAVNQANAQNAAYAAQVNAQAAAQAVTNQDLVEMTRAGLSDELIISTIRSRGARFDTSPSSLIYLKQNGVNDRVVIAAQSAGGPAVAAVPVAPAPIATYPVAPVAPVYVAPAPVYYQPAPVIRVYSGGYGPYYHHHHHHGW
ncbi:MAG: YMGG-like glycine zipper-containing protein [Pirellulales bacterium]